MSCAEYKLLALDLDGTLLDTHGHIAESSREAIRAAQQAGVEVVLATGRDYNGILWEELGDVSVDYVVTNNGSAVYQVKGRKSLFEQCLDNRQMVPVFRYLLQKGVYIDVFIDGRDYAPPETMPLAEKLDLPDYVIRVLLANRTPVEHLVEQLEADALHLQKVTLNFWKEPDGTYHSRNDVLAYLKGIPGIVLVDGGFANLEFTAQGVSKATGLRFLTDFLGLSMEQIMAIGDSENDAEMLRAVGLGVAMGNAYPSVKALADAVTDDNESDGVAKAIRNYLL